MGWKDILKYNADEYWGTEDEEEPIELIHDGNEMEIMEAAFGDRNLIKDAKELRDKEPEMRKKLIKYLREHYPLVFEDSEELDRHDGFHPDYGMEVVTRDEEDWLVYFFDDSASSDLDFWPEERDGKLWDGHDEYENWEDWERNKYSQSSYFNWWKNKMSWE